MGNAKIGPQVLHAVAAELGLSMDELRGEMRQALGLDGVADDPAYKYGLLLGALDELIERWSKASVTYSDSREGAMLGVALGELREVVRIHG